ncbi:hypothetical protein [Lacrimispora sp.]|uniref:hypothetical protein n=1 Tax=Lacrimispora sp. TaxID=2719234 RepID=UPI00285D37D2|nr:hypothetical protein [Lacrimispora sp.]MDR7812061.1 hypothetical protein [Lacrimispora sp.]
MKRVYKCIIIFLACTVLSFFNEKYHFIVTSYKDMIGYQFNIFTISTVLAGFSFTTLGTLLGMSSEALMKKLKDTTIVTNKSRRIVKSLLCFCCTGLISLFYIVGLDQLVERAIQKIERINLNFILDFIFLLGIIFLVLGIIYFIISVYEIYDLIKRVYGCDTEKYKKLKEDYKVDIQEAKKRSCETRDDKLIDEFTRE